MKTMEIRFFAPGSLVSNLDFVEGIFGNGGDPYLPENDAALDVMHWTGHTGCVIVAPHLAGMKKKDLGLPHEKDATERQRRDGMFWRDPDEPYNGGGAFKVACRDERGVMVTIIADNYYGYCKKEVKTQISFAANLYGLCEEEHAGGAIAFATYVLGQDFRAANAVSLKKARFRRCHAPAGADGRTAAGRLRGRPPVSGHPLRAGRFGVQCARRLGAMAARRAACGSLTLRADATYVLPYGFRIAHGEAAGRIGLEAGGRAPARHAVPQALHGFRRRQIGNFEVDRQRDSGRAGFRGRLSPRHRAGGGNPEDGFFRHLQGPRRPTSARSRPDSEPGADDGLGDPAVYAFAGI